MKSRYFTPILRACSLIAIIWLSADLFLHDYLVATVAKKLERFGVSDVSFRVGIPGLRGVKLRDLSFAYRTGSYLFEGRIDSVSLSYDLLAGPDKLVNYVGINGGTLVVDQLGASSGQAAEKSQPSIVALRPLIDEFISSIPIESCRITELVVRNSSGTYVVTLDLKLTRREGFVLEAASRFGVYATKTGFAYSIDPPSATVSALVTEGRSVRAQALLEATFAEKSVRLGAASNLTIAPVLLGFPDQELTKLSIATPWTFTLSDNQVSVGPARAQVGQLTLTTPTIVVGAGALNLQLQRGVLSRTGSLVDLRGSIKATDVSVVLPAETPRTFHLESVTASYDEKERRNRSTSFGVSVAITGLNIEELLALYPQEEIGGTGVADSEFELMVREGSNSTKGWVFSVTNGTVGVRPPGGRLSYQSKALADPSHGAVTSGLNVLADFRYSGLSGEFDFSEGGGLVLRLKLQGSNPGWQNGRAVQLNINVEENVYELLRSLRLTTDVTNEVNRALQSPSAP